MAPSHIHSRVRYLCRQGLGHIVGNGGSEGALPFQMPRVCRHGIRPIPRSPLGGRKKSLRPWMVDIRRAATGEIRSALLRAKRHLPPANSPGQEDVFGRGGDVPREGTSVLFTAAGPRTEQVAMEPIGRIRLNRAPPMKFKHLLGQTCVLWAAPRNTSVGCLRGRIASSRAPWPTSVSIFATLSSSCSLRMPPALRVSCYP